MRINLRGSIAPKAQYMENTPELDAVEQGGHVIPVTWGHAATKMYEILHEDIEHEPLLELIDEVCPRDMRSEYMDDHNPHLFQNSAIRVINKHFETPLITAMKEKKASVLQGIQPLLDDTKANDDECITMSAVLGYIDKNPFITDQPFTEEQRRLFIETYGLFLGEHGWGEDLDEESLMHDMLQRKIHVNQLVHMADAFIDMYFDTARHEKNRKMNVFTRQIKTINIVTWETEQRIRAQFDIARGTKEETAV